MTDEAQGRAEELAKSIVSLHDALLVADIEKWEKKTLISSITQTLRAEREKALEEAAGIAEEFTYGGVGKVIAQAIRQLRENVTLPAASGEQAVVNESLTTDHIVDVNNMVCPSCASPDPAQTHAAPSAMLPETNYWRCEACDHQWGHE